MQGYKVNTVDRFTNLVKIFLVFLSFVFSLAFLSFIFTDKYFTRFIIFLLLIFILITITIIFDKFSLYFLTRYRIDSQISDNGLRLLEKLSLKASIKSPRMIVIDDDNYICYSLGLLPHKSLVIISKKTLEDFTEEQLNYVLAFQVNHLRSLNTCLFTYLAILIGSPIYLLEKFCIFLDKKKYTVISWILNITLLKPFSFLIALIFSLFLSKRRVLNSDLGASKLLQSTRHFGDTLKLLYSSPNKKSDRIYMLMAPMSICIKQSDAFIYKYLATQPNLQDRLILINSIIG